MCSRLVYVAYLDPGASMRQGKGGAFGVSDRGICNNVEVDGVEEVRAEIM